MGWEGGGGSREDVAVPLGSAPGGESCVCQMLNTTACNKGLPDAFVQRQLQEADARSRAETSSGDSPSSCTQ